ILVGTIENNFSEWRNIHRQKRFLCYHHSDMALTHFPGWPIPEIALAARERACVAMARLPPLLQRSPARHEGNVTALRANIRNRCDLPVRTLRQRADGEQCAGMATPAVEQSVAR